MKKSELLQCCLILTGCIKPNKDVPFLKLNNYNQRLKQYLESIKFFILHSCITNIVFCDNSNSEIDEQILLLAKENGKNLEWLSFKGNDEAVVKFGKGYGEGEIIEYVMNNSNIMRKCDYIIKITGRMIVKNIDFLIRTANIKKIYMYPMLFYGEKCFISTKMYMMPKAMYMRFFYNAYMDVRDLKGIYLETVFADVVNINNLVIKIFIIDPDFLGYSGTSEKKIESKSFYDRAKNNIMLYYKACILRKRDCKHGKD